MKQSYYVFFLAVIILFQSCATIIKGSKQSVRITSYPSQAAITINGKPYGQTPTVARLKRIDSQFIRIEMEGYKPYETMLTRKFNGWIFGNIVFGGLLGIIIDAATGSMYNLSPDQINAHFKSDIGTLYKDKNEIFVGVTLQPDPSWQKIGELEKE